jgi:transposase
MRAKKHNPAEAAAIQEMRKTMTIRQIAAAKGVNESVIYKILDEHGEARGLETYKPRVLQAWPPHTDFSRDELARAL